MPGVPFAPFLLGAEIPRCARVGYNTPFSLGVLNLRARHFRPPLCVGEGVPGVRSREIAKFVLIFCHQPWLLLAKQWQRNDAVYAESLSWTSIHKDDLDLL
jgi:hypothetical protein